MFVSPSCAVEDNRRLHSCGMANDPTASPVADVTSGMHSIRDCLLSAVELTLCTQSLHRHGSAKMQREIASMRLNNLQRSRPRLAGCHEHNVIIHRVSSFHFILVFRSQSRRSLETQPRHDWQLATATGGESHNPKRRFGGLCFCVSHPRRPSDWCFKHERRETLHRTAQSSHLALVCTTCATAASCRQRNDPVHDLASGKRG